MFLAILAAILTATALVAAFLLHTARRSRGTIQPAPAQPLKNWGATFKNALQLVKRRYLRRFMQKKRKNGKKTQSAEFVVGRVLNSLPTEYRHLPELLFRINNRYVYIDYAVISPYGIYVIEALNYPGWIEGSENNEFWKQTLSKYRRMRFYNPAWQVTENIMLLRALLSEYAETQYYPVITFSRKARLKSIQSRVPVVFDTDVGDTIYSIRGKKCLNTLEIKAIYQKMQQANITDPATRDSYWQT